MTFRKEIWRYHHGKVLVASGLWRFWEDNNVPSGIALRRHPSDRRVLHPNASIAFYRVQGTEGWVFDRRRPEGGGDDTTMLVEEDMVEAGLFVYESIESIASRAWPSVKDESRTDRGVVKGELISADIVRQSPHGNGNGPFLRPTDGSGRLFEHKENVRLMRPILVRQGHWRLTVENAPAGIKLRLLPIDSEDLGAKHHTNLGLSSNAPVWLKLLLGSNSIAQKERMVGCSINVVIKYNA